MNLKTKLFYPFLSLVICFISAITLTACSGDDAKEDEPDSPENPTNNSTAIIQNTWYSEYISSSLKSYDLLEFKGDGTFVYYYVFRVNDSKVNRDIENGTYNIVGDKIYLTIGDTNDEGNFTIKNGVLDLSCRQAKFDGKFYKSSLKNLDNITVGKSYMEMDPVDDIMENSPYRNFMHGSYSGTHCYVELSKVEMQCEHGTGRDPNYRYLRFCGPNGKVSPNGALVLYIRPNDQGIDKYWPDGTYTVNSGGGYYSYTIHPYFDGRDYIGSGDEETLTIKSNGKFKVFDYKSDCLRIHYEGTIQD